MSDARARLATAQGDLLRALVAGAPPPSGFDAARLRTAAAALLAKRAHGVRRALPELAESLGSTYHEVFAAYAAGRPRRTGETSLIDALAFGDWARLLVLPTAAHVEIARVEMRSRSGRVAVRRVPGYLLVIGGQRVLKVPLPR
jgi:hypothetical protein